MKRPWWALPAPDSEDGIGGTPGEGKTLVTTRSDAHGVPDEQVWVTQETAPDWDETNWKDDWK